MFEIKILDKIEARGSFSSPTVMEIFLILSLIRINNDKDKNRAVGFR